MRHPRRLLSGMVLALALAGSLTDHPAVSQAAPSGHADDDGRNLWLKYHAVGDARLLADYRSRITQIIVQDASPLGISARDELPLGGVGYDRTRAGSGFVDQYSAAVSDMYDGRATTPPELLLWFHHVPYTYEVFPGKTVIQWIYDTHFDGEAQVQGMIDKWVFLRGRISPVSFADVLKNLRAQKTQANIWRRHVNHYFWDLSGIADDQARDVGQDMN
ncbi:MAG: hypothetical protein ACYDAH_09220 [Steroidobacteraceae bacterium]